MHVGRRLQVDHQVGRRHVAREQLVQPLVDEELVVVEVQVREDFVLVEQVVADRRLAEQVRLPQRRLLPVAVEQVKQLGLQRRAGPVRVEVREERVVGVFEDDGRVQARAEPLGQRGLTRANRPFDRDVAKLQDGADDIIAPVFSVFLRRASCCRPRDRVPRDRVRERTTGSPRLARARAARATLRTEDGVDSPARRSARAARPVFGDGAPPAPPAVTRP